MELQRLGQQRGRHIRRLQGRAHDGDEQRHVQREPAEPPHEDGLDPDAEPGQARTGFRTRSSSSSATQKMKTALSACRAEMARIGPPSAMWYGNRSSDWRTTRPNIEVVRRRVGRSTPANHPTPASKRGSTPTKNGLTVLCQKNHDESTKIPRPTSRNWTIVAATTT